jgi:hypothetical protein
MNQELEATTPNSPATSGNASKGLRHWYKN